jgi:predicted TIM-barrel fold metal-dependent hydrolase
MADKQIIDVHCHLFNVQYAVMEFAAATWNLLKGDYPHKSPVALETKGMLETLEGIKDFAAWIARLVEVALSDCGQNLDFQRSEFSQSKLNDNELVVVPLMMDIYFSLDDNRDERAVSPPEAFAIPDSQGDDFNAHFDKVVNLIRDEINKKIPEIPQLSSVDQKLNEIFASARAELLAPPEKGDAYEGIELSPGYKKHMHDLDELSANYPATVFPFLAVDPRRIGIMDLIDMKVNKGAGVFKGIKLYPPLGYLPTHPALQLVFEHCNKYDIPITFHCSNGGIQNFRKKNCVVDWDGNSHLEDFASTGGNKSSYYTAPDKWLRVLERWPNLRVNFAHFGGGDSIASGDTGWMYSILNILKKYSNAYADISYFSKPELVQIMAELIEKHEILKRRLMFGTDYVMVMMDRNLGGLKSYFDRLSGLDRRLLVDNARAFLRFGGK